jgi:hypothetical protein
MTGIFLKCPRDMRATVSPAAIQSGSVPNCM